MTEKNSPRVILAPGFGFRVMSKEKCINVFLEGSVSKAKPIAILLSKLQLGEKIPIKKSKIPNLLYHLWKKYGGRITNFNRFNNTTKENYNKLNFDHLFTSGLRTRDKTTNINWQEIEKWIKDNGMKIEYRKDHPFKRNLEYPFPITVVKNSQGDVISEGKGFTKIDSRRSALGEAVERILSKEPNNKSKIVYGSYLEIFKREFIEIETGPRDLFSNELITEWSSAYNLSNNQMTWIPTEMAYMSYIPSNGIRAFGLHHTTGLSAGASIEEATINGIFEVLERDVYWNVMRCRLNCPDISLNKFKSNRIQKIINFCKKNNLEVVVKDISLDWGIPIAHVILKSTDQTMPGFSHGTGASFDWTTSIHRALLEAIQVYSGLSEIVRHKWNEVTNVHGIMSDGRMAWIDPLFYPHIKHLIEKSKRRFNKKILTTSIKELIYKLNKRSHKIIVSELNSLFGIHIVRVYITGATQPDERLERMGRRLQKSILKYCKNRGAYWDPILT